MITNKVDERLALQAKDLVMQANNIVITAHVSPDGDAVGSTLAMCNYLKSLGKKATVVLPNAFPAFFKWMPGAKDIIIYKDKRRDALTAINQADLIISQDYNELKRLGEEGMPNTVGATKCKKLMIDHHLKPGDFADVIISYPLMSSTCELLYRILQIWNGGQLVSTDVAACIYTGMMTDTGSFSYNSNDPDIYYIVADLIKAGIDKDEIHRNVFNNYTADRYKMMGYALTKMEIIPEYGASIITMSRAELNSFNYRKGDTEGFVNMPLSIKGVCFSAFLKEEDGLIKISLRSQGEFPCNIVASENFGGGGHLNASGGEARNEQLEQVAQRLRDALPRYKEYFDKELAKLTD